MKSFIIVLFVLPFHLLGQGSFNIQLLDNWQNDSLLVNSSDKRYNDCWGFVQNGKEYGILGSTEGTHIFEITDDGQLMEIDFVPGTYQASTVVHRDLKVYQNYLYSVCDEGANNLQIIDLSYLPDSVQLVAEITDSFYQVHNLFIDETNALLYSCGVVNGTTGNRKLEVYDITNPIAPNLVWTPNDPGAFPYVHDAYVRDNIAYLSCGDNGLRIYDFTNPASPIYLQNLDVYQEQGYNHQGWMTPDGSKFIFADETIGKKIKNCNVNADHTVSITNYFGTNYQNNSVPHNIMLSNEFAFVAYYNEGLRIYDLRKTQPEEIAHYDTYGDDPLYKMEGAWGVYSDLPSGRILISDRHTGLYLFDFNRALFSLISSDDMLLFPNPLEEESLTIKLNLNEIDQFDIELYNLSGEIVFKENVVDQSYFTFEPELTSGCYIVLVTYNDYLGDEQTITQKLIIR